MLKKSDRLTNECFEMVFNSGNTVSGSVGYIKFARTDDCSGVACVAPQSDTENSVERTRIRRRGYAAVEEFFTKIPDNYGVIWFLDSSSEDVPFQKLVDSFANMIEQTDIHTHD